MMRKLWIKNTPEDRIAILQQGEGLVGDCYAICVVEMCVCTISVL